MRKTAAALALAFMLVVSGCAALDSGNQTTTTTTTTSAPTTTQQPTATTTQATTTQSTTTATGEADLSVSVDAPPETDTRTMPLTVTVRNDGDASGAADTHITVARVGYKQYNESYTVRESVAPGEQITIGYEYDIRATGDYAIYVDGERRATVEANSWSNTHVSWLDRVKATVDGVFDGTAEVGI